MSDVNLGLRMQLNKLRKVVEEKKLGTGKMNLGLHSTMIHLGPLSTTKEGQREKVKAPVVAERVFIKEGIIPLQEEKAEDTNRHLEEGLSLSYQSTLIVKRKLLYSFLTGMIGGEGLFLFIGGMDFSLSTWASIFVISILSIFAYDKVVKVEKEILAMGKR